MRVWRKAVFIVQWFAVPLLPLWWVMQPGAFHGGWTAVLMMLV